MDRAGPVKRRRAGDDRVTGEPDGPGDDLSAGREHDAVAKKFGRGELATHHDREHDGDSRAEDEQEHLAGTPLISTHARQPSARRDRTAGPPLTSVRAETIAHAQIPDVAVVGSRPDLLRRPRRCLFRERAGGHPGSALCGGSYRSGHLRRGDVSRVHGVRRAGATRGGRRGRTGENRKSAQDGAGSSRHRCARVEGRRREAESTAETRTVAEPGRLRAADPYRALAHVHSKPLLGLAAAFFAFMLVMSVVTTPRGLRRNAVIREELARREAIAEGTDLRPGEARAVASRDDDPAHTPPSP